jgi:hypothetical protein
MNHDAQEQTERVDEHMVVLTARDFLASVRC